MADLNDVQLLAEAVLALAKAVRDAPPPVYNVTVQASEAPDHPITVTVIEREREDAPPPVVNVPITVSPTPVTVEAAAVPPVQVEIREAAEAPDPTSWEVLREDFHPYRITGFRAR